MRARWVKPEFFRDRTIGKLGPMPSLVFQALWCMADDGGVAMCDPARMKGEMFLFWDAVSRDDIEGALNALAAAGRITLYTVGEESYAEIMSWRKHQHVHLPSSFRHPRRTAADGLTQPLVSPAESLPQGSPPRHLDTQTPRHPDVGVGGADDEGQQPPTNGKPRNGSVSEFEEFWKTYPARTGGANKQGALRMWTARIVEGLAPAFLIERARIYGAYCTAEKITGTTKVMMASTFLGRDRRYEDDYAVSSLKLEPASALGSRSESKPYSREWLQKNGYPLPPVDAEEVA